MNSKWLINSNQSDVLIEDKNSLIAYLGGNNNEFSGYIVLDNDTIEDASVAFSLALPKNTKKQESIPFLTKMTSLFEENEAPMIQFKSTSFQKINKNINFLKGDLTIKNITKSLELETEFLGINNYDGQQKGSFEVSTKISRLEFDHWYNLNTQHGGRSIGRDIKLIANLEFLM
ncbi:YceI family protein [Flavobacterium sp. TSSA_36]|uniref:YceI family protein n=1 Tax=Flavobacterium sp. TSSA_36 TaxID=3447669 RepID=UPI003F31260C